MAAGGVDRPLRPTRFGRAIQSGNYLQGPYASLAKSDRDAEVYAVFEEVGL